MTGTKAGYNTVTRTSAPTGAVQPRSFGVSDCVVDLKGKAKVGKTLRSSVSACPAGATLRYQWYAGSKPLNGANSATLKLRKKQLGLRLRVLVTVERAGLHRGDAGQREDREGAQIGMPRPLPDPGPLD